MNETNTTKKVNRKSKVKKSVMYAITIDRSDLQTLFDSTYAKAVDLYAMYWKDLGKKDGEFISVYELAKKTSFTVLQILQALGRIPSDFAVA